MPSKIDRINKLAPGSRSNFSLLAGPYWRTPSAIRSVVEIPVTLVRGAKDGPTFCVIAGVHGTEYAGIGAAIRLSTEVVRKPSRETSP